MVLKTTNKTKRIKNRPVEIFVCETIKQKAKPYGAGGCHVTIPKRFNGRDTEVNILVPKPFLCNNCLETITKEQNFSENPNLCSSCFIQSEAIKNNKCSSCGGKNPKKEYWGGKNETT